MNCAESDGGSGDVANTGRSSTVSVSGQHSVGRRGGECYFEA